MQEIVHLMVRFSTGITNHFCHPSFLRMTKRFRSPLSKQELFLSLTANNNPFANVSPKIPVKKGLAKTPVCFGNYAYGNINPTAIVLCQQ